MTTYDPREVLEALLEERRDLDSAIAYFRRVVARSTVRAQTPSPKVTTQDTPKEEPKREGPYSGMSNPDAALAYLKEAGEPKTPKEIERALLEGGLETTAKNFYGTLYTTLRRLEESGEIKKLEDGTWAIAPQPSPTGWGAVDDG